MSGTCVTCSSVSKAVQTPHKPTVKELYYGFIAGHNATTNSRVVIRKPHARIMRSAA